MVNFFKSILVFCVLTGGIWFLFEDELAKVLQFNYVKYKKKRGEFLERIVDVQPEQIGSGLETSQLAKKTLIIYFYNTQCEFCAVHLKQVNDYSQTYDREDLFVMAVAVGEERENVATFLADHLDKLAFHPLRIELNQLEDLTNVMRQRASIFDGSIPYISVVDKFGVFYDIPQGLNRENRFKGTVERALGLQ